MRSGRHSLQATLQRREGPPLQKAFLPQPFLPRALQGKRQDLVRRCKTVSLHYINHLVPGPCYRSFLHLPPPPRFPANGAPGDHRLPAGESEAPWQRDLQICEGNIGLQMKMCSWMAVCKPGGSAAWLAPEGTQRRWCPKVAW